MNDSEKYKVSDEFAVCDGWESPINIIADEIVHKIERDAENNLMHTVKQTIGFEVDKEELLKALHYDRGQYNKGFEVAKRLYKRPKGRWEKITIMDYLDDKEIFKCNQCNFLKSRFTKYNYCPNCGADMKEEEE